MKTDFNIFMFKISIFIMEIKNTYLQPKHIVFQNQFCSLTSKRHVLRETFSWSEGPGFAGCRFSYFLESPGAWFSCLGALGSFVSPAVSNQHSQTAPGARSTKSQVSNKSPRSWQEIRPFPQNCMYPQSTSGLALHHSQIKLHLIVSGQPCVCTQTQSYRYISPVSSKL